MKRMSTSGMPSSTMPQQLISSACVIRISEDITETQYSPMLRLFAFAFGQTNKPTENLNKNIT